jgi:hypothetical protein
LCTVRELDDLDIEQVPRQPDGFAMLKGVVVEELIKEDSGDAIK